VARYNIFFFLEDTAQESFIPAMVKRLIADEEKELNDYHLQILSARGGGSIRAYKDFLKQAKKRKNLEADVLIVGSDGNCNGLCEKKAATFGCVKGHVLSRGYFRCAGPPH